MSTSPTLPPASGVSSPPHPTSPSATGSPSSDIVEDPEHLTIQLNIRKLPALTAHNGNLAHGDTFHILCARIRGCIPTNVPGVRWPINGQPYVKPSKHATAKLFQLLDEDNYLESLKKAWRMEIKRGVSPADVVVQVFAYVQYPEARAGASAVNAGGGSGTKTHRTTAGQKTAAAERIQQAIDNGPLQAPGWIARAREAQLRDPDEPVTIPEAATFRQTRPLDLQKEQPGLRREAQNEEHVSKYQTIEVRIQGALLSFEVNVENLRSVLRLPP